MVWTSDKRHSLDAKPQSFPERIRKLLHYQSFIRTEQPWESRARSCCLLPAPGIAKTGKNRLTERSRLENGGMVLSVEHRDGDVHASTNARAQDPRDSARSPYLTRTGPTEKPCSVGARLFFVLEAPYFSGLFLPNLRIVLVLINNDLRFYNNSHRSIYSCNATTIPYNVQP